MAAEAITSCSGLVLQSNPLQAQPGALVRANDCVINRENIVEDRRGYALYFALSGAASQLFVFQNKVLALNGTTITYDNGGSGANYSGTYSAPSGKKLRSVEAFQNLYASTSQGVQVFGDTAGTQARLAGSPRPLDIILSSTANSSSGVIPAGNQCAYRTVVKRTDANGNAIFSYPSNRTLVSNILLGGPGQTQITGTLSNGSNQLTSLSSTSGIQNGMTITGQGIPLGTTVSSLVGSTVTMSQTASLTSYTPTGNTTSGSDILSSISSTQNLVVGMTITGTGIPASSTITSINASANSITISANASGTGSAIVLTCTLPATGVFVTFGWAVNPTLNCYLPTEVTTSDLIQIYRTTTTSNTSTDPGEEMALVYQVNPASSDISRGYIQFQDLLIDALRGASLYTSPSQLTMSGANDRPPLAKDIALYKNNYLMLANTSTKQRLNFALISTASLSGRTITLAGVNYTFGSSEIISSGQAVIGSTGVVAADIESTARSLVKVINQYSANTSVYAYYQSGPQDPPGKIMIEERGIGASAFTLLSGDTTIQTQFSPQPPVGSPSSLCTSSNQVQKNAIYFSQFQQPEAFPILNSIIAGPANKEILRIAPLRNSLIIIKEEGVYRLTGDSPQNFVVTPLDLTVFCKSPDSVAVLANTVIMLSNQGVVQITETAVQVISWQIEPAIKPLLINPNISTLAVAIGYESDRSYLLSVPTLSSDLVSNQIFRFNVFTRTWTRWGFGFTCAVIEPGADKLYFAKVNDSNLYRERKSYTDSDFADPETSITIQSLNSGTNTVIFSITGATPQPGWVIQQNSVNLAIQTVSGNQGVYTAVMQGAIPSAWVTGAALLFPSVGMDIVWDAYTGMGGAALLKQINEAVILTDNIPGYNSAQALVPTFYSNFDVSQDEVPLYLGSSSGWGDSWGAMAWGGVGDVFGYRTFVPRNKQMCRTLNVGVKHKNALERLSCAGYAVNPRALSERIGR